MATESYEKLITDLKKLRLPAMAEMLDSYAKQAASSSMSYVDFLGGLVSEEVSRKEQRSVQNRIKSARFPVLKSLDDFDYAFQPSIDRKKVGELSNLRFIDNKENILFLGPSGVGKTHVSTGLGVRACESGYKVLFTTLNDIQPPLLVIDEVGYLPVPKEGANFLFQVVAKRYETGSIILTSNKSFADWGEVLGDSVIAAAILDRLLHHSTVFSVRGDSYRLREKKKLMGKEGKTQ